MSIPKVLVVEDDDAVRMMLHEGLQRDGFSVVSASNVCEALKHIVDDRFDVLLSDLHLPQAGDGFAVVSAMRHTHPKALTVVLSGYPALDEAMSAIVAQADEILTKPVRIAEIKQLVHDRLNSPRVTKKSKPESVASILERDLDLTIQNWLKLVEQEPSLIRVPLTRAERTGHLPRLILDLILRLRLDSGLPAPISMAAREHGQTRQRQGYIASMVVEESRVLQVSIFGTLQRNLPSVDFSKLLLDVVTIADEVDSQLRQAMLSFDLPSLSALPRAG